MISVEIFLKWPLKKPYYHISLFFDKLNYTIIIQLYYYTILIRYVYKKYIHSSLNPIVYGRFHETILRENESVDKEIEK